MIFQEGLMPRSKITIVGAGLSGMTAGINLAREGYDVEIWEGGKAIGAMEKLHPSVHATPINPRDVSDYIGIDITSQFTQCRRLAICLRKKHYELNPGEMHLVERGIRETSIDNFLYKTALKCGVKFRFNTLVKSMKDIPEDAIVATGLVKEGMDAIGVKTAIGTGCFARKKLDNPKYKDVCMAWADNYTADYGYLSVVNDLMFYVVFNRGDLTEKQAGEAKQHLIETEGLEFPKWEFSHAYLPMLERKSLQLFKDNRILTGTLSGMIDPAALYGIHGALMAGKIAFWAVTDKEKALSEFTRLNKNFQKIRIASNYMRKMPMRINLLRIMFTFTNAMTPFMRLIDSGIPGYKRHWAIDTIKNRKR